MERKEASNPGSGNKCEQKLRWACRNLEFICLECRPSELVVGDEARVGNLGWIQRLGVPVGDKELMEVLGRNATPNNGENSCPVSWGQGAGTPAKIKVFD